MATYLSAIIDAHRAAAEVDRRDPDQLYRAALAAPVGARRSFAGALADHSARHGLAVIAEIKRRSPSKGDLAPDLDPGALAARYADGGAVCLSVLTEAEAFGGSPEDLQAARRATELPVLRKDFTVSPADVCDARLMGADAVLLIVAALAEAELAEYLGLATSLGLSALVEVHDEGELERALAAGATLVGVNQRDLRTFAVDPGRAERVGALIPEGVLAVAESGIGGSADAARLAGAGFQAILVGESLVTSPDPSAAVGQLGGHRIGERAPPPWSTDS